MAPQIVPFFFEDSVNSGDTVSIQCIISKGDSPLKLIWTLNDKIIESDERILIMKTKRVSSLTIESVQAEHAGEFACKASNVAGESSYSQILNVNGTICLSRSCSTFVLA